jgi:hypothetical protein
MIDAAQEITTCLACGSTIIQISGRGHRKQQYCDVNFENMLVKSVQLCWWTRSYCFCTEGRFLGL